MPLPVAQSSVRGRPALAGCARAPSPIARPVLPLGLHAAPFAGDTAAVAALVLRPRVAFKLLLRLLLLLYLLLLLLFGLLMRHFSLQASFTRGAPGGRALSRAVAAFHAPCPADTHRCSCSRTNLRNIARRRAALLVLALLLLLLLLPKAREVGTGL